MAMSAIWLMAAPAPYPKQLSPESLGHIYSWNFICFVNAISLGQWL